MKKMNLEDIQELIKFVAKSGATEVDLEIDNIKISIKSPAKKRRGEVDIPTTMIHQTPAQIVTQAPVSVPADTPPIETTPENESKNEEDKGLGEIIVGKHRNGPTDTIPLGVDDSIGRFITIDSVNKQAMAEG